MKKAVSFTAAIAFAVLYPFAMISSSFSVSNSYFGFHSFFYIYIRYLIIFSLMFILVYLNRDNKKLLYNYAPTAMAVISLLAYIDYFFTHHFVYNYGYLLWLGVVFSVANAGVFLSATIFINEDYVSFYKRFWSAYLIFYILILYVSFIRNPDFQSLSINTELGNGTLKYFKAVFNDPKNNLYTSLICFGNILILFPVPFIVYSFKRPPLLISIIIGVSLPLIFEGYQYVLKCGDVDIDDILLNLIGYLLALTVAETIYIKIIKPSQ